MPNSVNAPKPMNTTATVIPTMRYQDAHAAIAWLCDVFGFHQHLVVEDGDGGIAHAQLTFGNGMVMLGSARDDAFGKVQGPLETPSAIVNQSAYVVVDGIDEHYDRVRGSGAKIVVEIREEDHGGRFYSCRDPQGQLWNVGSYDPWAEINSNDHSA